MNKEEIWNLIQEDYDNKNFTAAYDKVSELSLNNPDNIDIFHAQAVLSSRLLDYNQTIDFCNKILLIDSKNLSALRIKASALESLKRPDESFKIYEQILKIIPNDAQSLLGKAYYLFCKNNSREFNKVCTRLININTANIYDLKSILTFLEVFARKYRAAVMICNKILKLDNKDIEVYIKRAMLLLCLKEYKRTVAATNEILLQDNMNVMAHIIKIEALEGLGKYNDVIVICDKLLNAFDDTNFNMLKTKASAYEKLHEYDKAIKIYKKLLWVAEEVLMCEPNNKNAKKFITLAELHINIAKINSNKKLSIHEGFDILVKYLWLYPLRF